jgi:threonine 3-dehydrogenase
MKALMKKGAEPGAVLVDIEIPTIGDDDVLLKVRATSICGTDRHIYDWNSWAQSVIQPPLVFGHEFTGEVVSKGRNVSTLDEGDIISVESHVPCLTCPQCTNGTMHICDQVRIIGVDRPGCFAEYVSVPAICAWKVPASMPPEIASIMEPMGNSVHAVSAGEVEGQTVVVMGCGPTGLFAIAVAKAEDAAKVIAVDINPKRLEMAGTIGADELLDGADPDLIKKICGETSIGGVDVVLEMSGSAVAMVNGLRCLKKGGTFISFGIPGKPVELDLANDLILPGRKMIGVVGRLMFETWEEMQRLLDSGKLDPAPIVTHRYSLDEYKTAFATLNSGEAGKVILFP